MTCETVGKQSEHSRNTHSRVKLSKFNEHYSLNILNDKCDSVAEYLTSFKMLMTIFQREFSQMHATSPVTFVSPVIIQDLTLFLYTAAIKLRRMLYTQSLLNALKDVLISYKNKLHRTKLKK